MCTTAMSIGKRYKWVIQDAFGPGAEVGLPPQLRGSGANSKWWLRRGSVHTHVIDFDDHAPPGFALRHGNVAHDDTRLKRDPRHGV